MIFLARSVAIIGTFWFIGANGSKPEVKLACISSGSCSNCSSCCSCSSGGDTACIERYNLYDTNM